MELMGVYEIAQAAGVSPQAVTNWVVRFADFPKPLATLASGSVWNAVEIGAWLERTGRHTAISRKEKNVATFVVGQTYTLDELQSALGGDRMSYLPESGGQVVCGRFKRDMNPLVPYEVWVGDPKNVQRKAARLAGQGGSIPVFIKDGPNRWFYHGRMEVVEYNTDPALATQKSPQSGRPVVGVLVLRDALEAR